MPIINPNNKIKNKITHNGLTCNLWIYYLGSVKFESLEHEKARLIVTSQNYCKNILKNWWRKKRTDINSISIE